MQTVTLARNAMATRFELVLHGENPIALRAAGEEAFNEIDRLENLLSLYRPRSEIARINAAAATEHVQVSPEVFSLLQRAQKLSEETGGAFDITVAPLVRCWGFMGANGRQPSPEEIQTAREAVGFKYVELVSKKRTVRFTRAGMMLDLGAIGKGYAVECGAELLREAGVTSALIHGGTSTAYALGHPPDAEHWTVALERPGFEPIKLRDEALSVSAIWGRSFESEGKTFGHVIDPRTGLPVENSLLAAVALPSATETDALSTALLTIGAAGHDSIKRLRPDMRTVLMTLRCGENICEARGF